MTQRSLKELNAVYYKSWVVLEYISFFLAADYRELNWSDTVTLTRNVTIYKWQQCKTGVGSLSMCHIISCTYKIPLYSSASSTATVILEDQFHQNNFSINVCHVAAMSQPVNNIILTHKDTIKRRSIRGGVLSWLMTTLFTVGDSNHQACPSTVMSCAPKRKGCKKRWQGRQRGVCRSVCVLVE